MKHSKFEITHSFSFDSKIESVARLQRTQDATREWDIRRLPGSGTTDQPLPLADPSDPRAPPNTAFGSEPPSSSDVTAAARRTPVAQNRGGITKKPRVLIRITVNKWMNLCVCVEIYYQWTSFWFDRFWLDIRRDQLGSWDLGVCFFSTMTFLDEVFLNVDLKTCLINTLLIMKDLGF